MKPSTSYAIVRSLLVLNETDRLINILRDKVFISRIFNLSLVINYCIKCDSKQCNQRP